MRLYRALLLAWTLACLPSVAAAQQWTPVAPGVDRYSATIAGPNRVRATRINLCYPGVKMRATTYPERGQKTSNWAPSVGVAAAINGGFFNFSGYGPDQGVAWGNGSPWPNSADTNVRGWIAFGDRQIDQAPAWAVGEPPAWTSEAVNGDATLVIDGVAVDCGGCGTPSPRPRTAVGYTADRKTVYFITVDGDNTGSAGMLIDQFAQLVATFGVDRAMNVDGGGSTTHWATGVGLTNIPSNGVERTVGNHLGVFAAGGGLTPHCPTGYHATYVGGGFAQGSGTKVTLEPGQTASIYLDFQNTGSETWQGPLRLATLPYDAPSPVAHPAWISAGRIVDVDAPTPPGDIGRFSFSVTAPAVPGVYKQEVDLLHEGVAWFSQSWGPVAGSFWFEVTVVEPPPWRAEIVGVTGFSGTAAVVTGETGATLSGAVEVRNTGANAWPADAVRIGTTNPRDHSSPLATAAWIGPNRVVANAAVVPPGSTAVLPMEVQLPSTPQTLSDSFGLVVEGVTWFADAGGPGDDAIVVQVTASAPVAEQEPELLPEPGPEPQPEPGPEPIASDLGPEPLIDQGPEAVSEPVVELSPEQPADAASDTGTDTDLESLADIGVQLPDGAAVELATDGYQARFKGTNVSSSVVDAQGGCQGGVMTPPSGDLWVGLWLGLWVCLGRRRRLMGSKV